MGATARAFAWIFGRAFFIVGGAISLLVLAAYLDMDQDATVLLFAVCVVAASSFTKDDTLLFSSS